MAGLEDFVLEAKTWREPVHVRIEPRAHTHTHTHVHTLQLQRDVSQGAHSAKMTVNPTDAFTC